MEIIIKAAIFNDLNNIETLNVKVNELNYLLIRKKIEFETKKMITYLKNLKENQVINSLSKPRNKTIQKELNYLIFVKKELKKSRNKLMQLFS